MPRIPNLFVNRGSRHFHEGMLFVDPVVSDAEAADNLHVVEFAQLVQLSNGSVLANMRNNMWHKRGLAISDNGGQSFGPIFTNPSLIEPVCMASIISAAGHTGNASGPAALFFSNPNTTSGRTHLTIKKSVDDGATWPAAQQQLVYAGAG